MGQYVIIAAAIVILGAVILGLVQEESAHKGTFKIEKAKVNKTLFLFFNFPEIL